MKGSCDKEKTAAIFSIQIHHNNSAFNPNLVWGGGGVISQPMLVFP